MTRLTDLVLRHRLLVAIGWLLIAVAGGATASTTVDRLSYDFALPGQEAYEVNQRIVEDFGSGGLNDPLLLVVEGDDAAGTAGQVAEAAARAVPGSRVVTPDDPGATGLSPDPATTVVVAYPPVTPGPSPYAEALPALEQIASQASGDGTTVALTGFTLLQEGGGDDRGLVVEVAIGAIGALVVLALVFGSLLAGVPLLVAAVSILGTFLALLGLTYLTDVSAVVEYLIALIGLGVAIDYSLLVVTRWREERSRGLANDEAVRESLRTAGRAVLFSGTTVAISLAALVIVPIPFLRSIGLGGLLIPLLSVGVSLTLVPALLSAVGPRLSWPRRSAATTRSRLWAGVARRVLRHRWLAIIGSVGVLLAMAAPALGITLGSAQLSSLTGSAPAASALSGAIEDGVPVGAVRPTELLVPTQDVSAVRDRVSSVEGVAAVAAPEGPAWRIEGSRLLQVWGADDPTTSAGRETLDRIRTLSADGTIDAEVGGSPAEDVDYIAAVYDNAVWVVLGVAIVTFLLLARALKSLWLPIKALALNVISLAAAYGLTVLIWQHGIGSELLFGQSATGAVTIWVPVAAFAFLFGLSMDYEVFLLSRMREEYDDLTATGAGSSAVPDGREATDRAVVEGMANTGRLVTSAALILFFAFIALSTVPAIEVKVLATTLALGIAIDAVIVRGVLAPALVGVLGRANWTIPGWLAKPLRVPAATR
ncbi:MMPL family transporter [Nocardioidaceae bacterium]|nr:MMPL family transporter [Nocardioidaceae bacterium]